MQDYLPKIIWFLWLQGKEEMPLVVSKCFESWLANNSNWEVRFLDQNNINKYIDASIVANERLTPATKSDLIRIDLLSKYGGVWADATTYCCKPLDSWVHENTTSGFFAFNKPDPSRMISSWFLASNKGNYLPKTYYEAAKEYTSHNLDYVHKKRLSKLYNKLASFNTSLWFSFIFIKVFKVYPYYWFHYLFENLYKKDKNFRLIWDNTPKLSADIPHRLQSAGLFKPLTSEIKEEIDNGRAPLYKLIWKYDSLKCTKGTIMHYLVFRDGLDTSLT